MPTLSHEPRQISQCGSTRLWWGFQTNSRTGQDILRHIVGRMTKLASLDRSRDKAIKHLRRTSFLAHDKARVIYAVGLVVRAANTRVSRVIRRKGGLMAMVFTVVANENRLWWVARDRVLNCNFAASHSTFLGLPIVGSFRATAFNGDFCAGMRLGRSPLPFPTLGGGCVTPADSSIATASCFSVTSSRSWHDLSREHQNCYDREPKQSLQHGA